MLFKKDNAVTTTEEKPEPEKAKFRWRVEDVHSPPEIYNWRLYMSIFVFGILGAARGLDEGIISGTTVQASFKELFGFNKPGMDKHDIADLKSNITSMVQLGSIGGSMIAMYVVDKLGRVRSLQVVCVCWIIAVIIQITAKTVGQLYAGRLLEGMFAIGLTTTIGPTYMSEVTPRAIRGMANCIFAGAVYLGIMLGYFANYGTALHVANTSRIQWVLPTSLKIIFAGLIFIGSFVFCIESPRWLLKVGKGDQAAAALSKLRNLPDDHPYIIGEISDINDQVLLEQEAKSGNRIIDLFKQLVVSKSMRYRFFALCCMIQLLGQWSGANAVTIYAPELFSYSGIQGIERLKMTAVLGVVKFTSAYISAFFIIDFLGRRKALYVGISIQMVCILFFALFLVIVPQAAHLDTVLTSSQLRASKAAMAALYLSGVGWTMGFNSMQYLIGSEIFPLHIRSFAQSLVMVLHFANQFGNSKALPKMTIALHPYGAFFFFTAVNVISLAWAYFFIPEVSGRSLESMEELFNLPWYLIGRKGNKLCPDNSEINKIDYQGGELHYKEKYTEEFIENASVNSDDKDDGSVNNERVNNRADRRV